jgi:hypothetical protein
MTEDELRETGKAVGIVGLMGLPIVAWLVGHFFDAPLVLAGVAALIWFAGGFLGIIIARSFVPVFNGCACPKHQASSGFLVIAFVLWPFMVPLIMLAAVAATLVRSALN